jgi:hypothetical protein
VDCRITFNETPFLPLESDDIGGNIPCPNSSTRYGSESESGYPPFIKNIFRILSIACSFSMKVAILYNACHTDLLPLSVTNHVFGKIFTSSILEVNSLQGTRFCIITEYCGVFTSCKNCNFETRSRDYETVDEAVFSPCRAAPRLACC